MKGILADTLHAVVIGRPVWLASGDAGSAAIDYRAEAMRYAFEPCIAASAWHSGMGARPGAAEAARILRERKAAEIARAADRIVERVRGQPISYRLGIYGAARIGCVDATLGLGRQSLNSSENINMKDCVLISGPAGGARTGSVFDVVS